MPCAGMEGWFGGMEGNGIAQRLPSHAPAIIVGNVPRTNKVFTFVIIPYLFVFHLSLRAL